MILVDIYSIDYHILLLSTSEQSYQRGLRNDSRLLSLQSLWRLFHGGGATTIIAARGYLGEPGGYLDSDAALGNHWPILFGG